MIKKFNNYIFLGIVVVSIIFILTTGAEATLTTQDTAYKTSITFEVIEQEKKRELPTATPMASSAPALVRSVPTRPAVIITISQEEIIVAAKMMWGEARGESDERCAATLWVALNRKDDDDRWPDSLIEVIEQSSQFTGYSKSNKTTPHLEWLAKDVLVRYELEKLGVANVGRTIPNDYFYFAGSTGINRFRKEYDEHKNHWDFSLPNPYEKVLPISFEYQVEVK